MPILGVPVRHRPGARISRRRIMGFSSRTGRAVAASALLGLLGLSGCSWFGFGKDDPIKGAVCPSVGVVPQLSRVSRFQGDSTSFNNLTYRGTLDNVKSSCSFTLTSVFITASVNLLAERGPNGADGVQNFDYFAVVTDDFGTVLTKRNFSAPLTFAPGQNRAGSAESLIESIPLIEPKQGVHYHVLVGFQLSAQERAYNIDSRAGQ
jgi:hypothetical protein